MTNSFSIQYSPKNTDVTFTDVLNSTQDKVHSQLYERALNRYIETNSIDKNLYRFIEIPQEQYDMPSKVQIISKTYPYKRNIISLEEYWENPNFETSFSYLLIDNDLTIETAQVKYKDYVKGNAELYSRMTGRTINVSLDSLPNDIEEYNYDYPSNDNFSYLIKI